MAIKEADMAGEARTPSGKKLPLPPQDPDGVLEAAAEEGVGNFVFRSKAMRDIHRIAVQIAGSDASILIYGESGTGKELLARLLHDLSNRRRKPFVPVNCGVLKGELFADKFFGHEAGAFTGANRLQKGSFELAGDGTLFLDEVGEIPPNNQVDFLRVVEEKTFKRLGGERDIPFAARIVAATNRFLPDMVDRGEFRADLYYRLNVVPVFLPPLRERPEDIPPLAEYFLRSFSHRYHKQGLRLDPATLRSLGDYSWPGNVRELRNLIERLVLLCPDSLLRPEHLPLEMQILAGISDGGNEPSSLNLDIVVREAETRAILRAFREAGGSKARTADLLGISPRTLRHKLAQYGLKL